MIRPLFRALMTIACALLTAAVVLILAVIVAVSVIGAGGWLALWGPRKFSALNLLK